MASNKQQVQKYRKWAFDFSSNNRRVERQDVAPPAGYYSQLLPDEQPHDKDDELQIKKNWDIALAPVKQLPMNLFIMWMAGNSISIFPIMMIGMMFIQPIRALLSIQSTWKTIEGSQAPLQCFVYLLGNLLGLALAVYKCQTMGLLPTHASDWILFSQPLQRLEWTDGGFLF